MHQIDKLIIIRHFGGWSLLLRPTILLRVSTKSSLSPSERLLAKLTFKWSRSWFLWPTLVKKSSKTVASALKRDLKQSMLDLSWTYSRFLFMREVRADILFRNLRRSKWLKDESLYKVCFHFFNFYSDSPRYLLVSTTGLPRLQPTFWPLSSPYSAAITHYSVSF